MSPISLQQRPRRTERVSTAIRTLEGEGFEVRRALPTPSLPAVGPFIFLDHFGPVDYRPGEAKGAPNHPHRGFETLTYMFEGSAMHRDSLGNVSAIGAGEAQWMRAGRGILHDEGADDEMRRKGGRFEGVQFWINLPRHRKMCAPAYRAIERADIPQIAFGDVTVSLLAGQLGEYEGAVSTWANPWLALVDMPAGSAVTLPCDAPELGIYTVSGEVGIGEGGHGACLLEEGHLSVLGAGNTVHLRAQDATRVFLLGGDPLDAPLRRYGPFVMNTDAELHEAVRDFQAGKFGTIPLPVDAHP